MRKSPWNECWYCHGTNLEPDSKGCRCRDCGATWNEIKKPFPPMCAPVKDLAAAGTTGSPRGRAIAKREDEGVAQGDH